MPEIWEIDNIFLFVAFVIPGFLMLKVYSLAFPGLPVDSSKQVIDVIAYSCINYALLSFPIFWIESLSDSELHQILYFLFYTSVLLFFPVVFAFIYIWMRKRNWEWMQRIMPHPTASPWDYVFGIGDSYWIIVTMADGKKAGGKFSSNSFASSAPLPEHIYLEEAWELNAYGGFERPRVDTAGVILISKDIVSVELFAMKPEKENDKEGQKSIGRGFSAETTQSGQE